MKKMAIVFLILCLAAFCTDVFAGSFTFYGRLKQGGVAYSGTKTMEFKIYNASSGGSLLWSTSQSVSVGNGSFSVELDPNIDWRSITPYLELVIDGTTLSPRTKITGAPYSTAVRELPSDYYASTYVNENQASSVSSSMIVDGTITNSDLGPGSFSNITGVGTLSSLTVSGNTYLATSSGSVGIGDSSPASLFTVGSGDLFQVNSSGNLVKINNVSYSWPSSQGSASTVLTNNGSGTLSWSSTSSNANTALSNLSSVAINTSLVSDADNTDDLGSSSISWKDIYGRTLKLDGSTLGTVTLQAPASFTSYSLIFPTDDGTSNQLLTTDGSGTLSWSTPATGTITEVVAGSGLTGGGSSGSVTVDISAGTGLTTSADSIAVDTAVVATTTNTLTMSGKTLTSPTITTSPTAAGATWTDLGSVTTADINGGTIDGATIGGSSTGAGSFTTVSTTGNVSIDNQSDLRLYEGDAGGSNYTGFQAPATLGADYLYTLPSDDGTSNQVLTTDGSGTLSWTSSSGATTALNNLASVAINTTLASDTTNTDDLGTSSTYWKDLYLAGNAYILGDIGSTSYPLDNIYMSSTASNSTSISLAGEVGSAYFKVYQQSGGSYNDQTWLRGTNSAIYVASSLYCTSPSSYNIGNSSGGSSWAGGYFGVVGIGTTSTLTARLHSKESGAKTTTNYSGYLENTATNINTDSINKYGLYITSTGSFTGSDGGATNNYGIYIITTAGADNNYDIYAYSGASLTTGGIWTNASSRENKQQIESLMDKDYETVIKKLDDINVVYYKYNIEVKEKGNKAKRHIGIIAEDSPDEITDEAKKGLPTGDAIGYLLAVAKAQQKQINLLSGKEIEKQLKETEVTKEGDLVVRNDSENRDLLFEINQQGETTEAMRIDGATGNVGIGQVAPNTTLDVAGTIKSSGSDSSWTTAEFGKGLELIQGNTIMWDEEGGTIARGISVKDDKFYILRSSEADTSSEPVYDMVIDENGNVGIGTEETEDYKLSVDGTISSTKGYSGYMISKFMNASGTALKRGDLVKIKPTGIPQFTGEDNLIPIGEVTLTEDTDEYGVLGIVLGKSGVSGQDTAQNGDYVDVVMQGAFSVCKVTGNVNCGAWLVSSANGYAKESENGDKNLIAMALEGHIQGESPSEYIAVLIK